MKKRIAILSAAWATLIFFGTACSGTTIPGAASGTLTGGTTETDAPTAPSTADETTGESPNLPIYEVAGSTLRIYREGTARLEAEAVDTANYKKSGDNATVIVERADASGGKFLAAATGDTSKGGYFEFWVELAFPAELTIILPYKTHYNVATDENTQWRFLSFDPTSLQSAHMHPDTEFLQKILSDCHLSGIFPPDKFPALAQSLTSATDLALSPSVDPFSEDCLLTELVHFLVLLSRTEHTDINVMQQINTESNRLMPALIAFSKELSNGRCLTIEEMANICHFSPSYFRKRFSELMGTHPKHFIIREQVRRAALLLITTNLPISEIQHQVGFSDPSAFFRNFTQRYHLSPTAYRKQNAGKPLDSFFIY